MSFSECAARLAGVAGWLLGWRPGEFWGATPGELVAVLRAAGGSADEGGSHGIDGDELVRLMVAMPD